MMLATLIILFSLLALGLLALLDRYDAETLKSQVARRNAQTERVNYYDAFTDRRQNPQAMPPTGQNERRKAVA